MSIKRLRCKSTQNDVLGFVVLTHEMQNAKCKMQNWDLPYGYHPPCHSERSRTKCGEVEESVLFTPFLGDGSFDSLRSLRMTEVVVTWVRRFEQHDKLKFEVAARRNRPGWGGLQIRFRLKRHA